MNIGRSSRLLTATLILTAASAMLAGMVSVGTEAAASVDSYSLPRAAGPAATSPASTLGPPFPRPAMVFRPAQAAGIPVFLDPIDGANADELAPLLELSDHGGAVSDAAFSPDGQLVATASVDGTVRLWSAAGGELIHELTGHSREVAAVDFSADGELLLSGSYDRSARLWSVGDGSEVETLDSPYSGYVLDVEFAPEGPYFLVADHLCDVQLRRAPTGLLDQTLRTEHCVTTEGTLRSWGLSFSPSGDYVVTGDGMWVAGGSIYRWTIEDPFERPKLLEGHNVRVRDLDYGPQGEKLAVALLGSPVFWLMDAEEGSLIRLFEGHTFRVNGVAFSPLGDVLASASRDPSLKIWAVEGGAALATYRAHTAALNSVEFSPTGDRLVTGSDDGTAIIWGVP